VISFILGKNTAPEKIKIEKVEVEKEVIVYKQNMSKMIDEDLEIKEVSIEKPDGTKSFIKTIKRKKNTDIDKKIAQNIEKSSKKVDKKLVTNTRRHTVSLFLLNPSLNESFQAQNLGLMYQNNLFLGITIGAGITANMSYFVSLGLNF
jgi:hypothetical protein